MNACDHDHMADGETRLLPIGGGGNVIVCRRHFNAETAFRRERILAGCPFDLPAWESLEIYGSLTCGINDCNKPAREWVARLTLKNWEPVPVCQEHRRVSVDGWIFLPEDEAARKQRVDDLCNVVCAIHKAWPDQAYSILAKLRYHPLDNFYSFDRWGMFVGVERDGYIHT